MVIFFEWHWTSMEPKSGSGLPMTGEEAGLGALASPLVGYLGKVQERAASLEQCPWCTSKGLTCALRSYRINLQESITLCTNPQCLFPLVSRPLEDVLASLVPVEPAVGGKRKTPVALEKEDFITPANKRLRSEGDDGEQQTIPDAAVDPSEHVAVVTNGQHAAGRADGEQVNGHLEDSLSEEASAIDSAQSEHHVVEKEPEESWSSTNGAAPPMCSGEDDAGQVENPPEVLNGHCGQDSPPITVEDNLSAATGEQPAQTEQKSLAADAALKESEELVPVPDQLFWKNSENLCWLDSLLVALVNCKSLRKCRPTDEPTQSGVWQLVRAYEEVCASVQLNQQTAEDGVVMVPNHVLQKANADLQSLRMSVFQLLQPKLHCKLGQKETPVFALPLLLATDSWAEPLFESTFFWEFKCSTCQAATAEWVKKTLPTFTNILPDWHPLNAVHAAPCNVCCKKKKKKERRTMLLESLPPVFALHFVQGLRNKDVDLYAFDFNHQHYSVTTVIQYSQRRKHFITWIRQPDGSWLEYDDLKHPHCKTHKKLPVPARDIHVVFWEAEETKSPQSCSLSSTFTESPSHQQEMCPSADDPALDDTLLASHDGELTNVFSLSEDTSGIMDTTVTADAEPPIGTSTLLDAFEGLSHNDIITFTLVELKADAEMQPENNNGQTEDLSIPGRTETLESAPDSSSAVSGSEAGRISSSDSEDNLSSDPTFEPSAKRDRTRGRGNSRAKATGRQTSRQTGRKAAKGKNMDPQVPPATRSEPEEEIRSPVAEAAQEMASPAETPQQTSPESSTDPSTNQKGINLLPVAHQSSCQSFLESKHLLMVSRRMSQRSAAAAALATPVKSAAPVQSVPNPVKRRQVPAALPTKPLLRTDKDDGLPPKAAEMYNGYGEKGSKTPSPMPPPAALANNSFNPQISLLNTTLVSGHSLPVGFTEISPSKKRSHSSKVPPGLSDVEALRYRLMKKLKAKKKRLAKLNQLLGHQGGASLQPDSTYLCSPSTVTSSTYDGSVSSDFLSDLLSPATTASNLSPDSTGFLEMIANRQDGAEQMQQNTNGSTTGAFLDDFLSQVMSQKPTEMETEALSALDLFL